MKRKEFIDLMRFYLKDYPRPVIEDIIQDYEMHFDMGREMGKSEEEISEELGSPALIANEYLSNERRMPSELREGMIPNEREKGNRKLLILLAIIGGLFILPPVFGLGMGLLGGIIGLLFGMIGLVIGLIVTILSLGISVIAGGASLSLGMFMPMPNFIDIPEVAYNLHPLTKVFASLSSLFLGILIIYLGLLFIRWCVKILKDFFVTLKWKWDKRRRIQ